MAKKNTLNPMIWSWLSVSRTLIGFVFLWAFFDKLLGLGIATVAEKAWINGGSPTTGFLSHVHGTFADFFHALAGNAGADLLFMAGLLGIGVALTLGIVVRVAVGGGVVLLLLMWLASLPLVTNPFIDEHVVYATVLVVVALSLPYQRYGFHKQWQSLPTIKKHPWLW